jgi:hypothetical protein
MERHAALPHFENAERIGDQLAEPVNQHVTDAAADDRAESDVEHDVVDVLRLDAAPRLLRVRARAEPAEHEPDEVHDPVPAHRDRADLERNGIEVRICKQGSPAASETPLV